MSNIKKQTSANDKEKTSDRASVLDNAHVNKKIAVVSLGCDKNRVDTESMLYSLANAGHKIIEDFDKAEVIIVNTCGFIQSARQEAVDTILQMIEKKKNNCCQKLIITGCFSKIYYKSLMPVLHEIDAYLGTYDYDKLNEIIDWLFQNTNPDNNDTDLVFNIPKFGKKRKLAQSQKSIYNVSCDFEFRENTIALHGEDYPKRILTTPPNFAYLKIADGCNNHCTYCSIPSIRGKYISRTLESLLKEAKGLCDSGVNEIILVAQDVTRYGYDLYGDYKLTQLLKELSKINFKRIRLMYCYPELVTDELLDIIDTTPNIAKYIDIPLQHYDDAILKLMGRRSSQKQIEDLIKRIRAKKNHIAIRSTFMVGFPSETSEQFENLCRFVKEVKLDHVGVFAYSCEEKTPSAKIKTQIPERIKNKRFKKITQILYENCLEKNNNLIGKTLEVVYEDIDYDRNMFVGRSDYDTPASDTNIYFAGEFAQVGQYYKVLITAVDGYDLIGEIVTK